MRLYQTCLPDNDVVDGTKRAYGHAFALLAAASAASIGIEGWGTVLG